MKAFYGKGPTWFFSRPIQDYLKRKPREARSMNKFLKTEEGISYQDRIGMYLTFPEQLPEKNPQKQGNSPKKP